MDAEQIPYSPGVSNDDICTLARFRTDLLNSLLPLLSMLVSSRPIAGCDMHLPTSHTFFLLLLRVPDELFTQDTGGLGL